MAGAGSKGVTRISFRKLLGMTDEVSELDYSLLVKVPDIQRFDKNEREALLDIEVEDLRVSGPNLKPFVVTLRSLGHSQHATTDIAGGRRFGSLPVIVIFPDLGVSRCWYDSLALCLNLFRAGNDIVWLDMGESLDDPAKCARYLPEAISAAMSFLQISSFSTISFGLGTGLVINQMDLIRGKHVCFYPQSPTGSQINRFLGQLRSSPQLQFMWIVQDKSSYGAVSEALNSDRLTAIQKGQQSTRPLILYEMHALISLPIPGDSTGRRVYSFSPEVRAAVLKFFMEIYSSFVIIFQGCFSEH